MSNLNSIRDMLANTLLAPRISEERLQERIAAIRPKLPIPVIWLLGKAQSGKTSVVRTLTGSTDAEIGTGFQPCTRTARVYDFPSAQDCFVRFLDTRGLGEVNYDPAEDMRVFMLQSHLLMVVLKAMDHAQEAVLEALRTIFKAHPEWPVIVVQTALHEGYPDQNTPHPEPYPYAALSWPQSVPADLARSLLKQREWFGGIEARFVAVDFTLPEDGYMPVDYGIEALWAAIEGALPLGLRAMVQVSAHFQGVADIYAKAAHPHIVTYAILAGGLEAIPGPMISIPLVLSLQAKMMQTIASIYGQKLNRRRYAEIAGALGLGHLMRWGGRELIKFIPFYGSAVSAAYLAGVTYALGKTLCAYFAAIKRSEVPPKSVFAKIYAEELRKGRDALARYVRAIRS